MRFRLERPRHESSEEDESKTKSARLPTCTLSVTLTQGVQGLEARSVLFSRMATTFAVLEDPS